MKTKEPHPPIKACSDVLTFGKHKGCSIEVVLGLDPGYIVWLVEENICEVSDEIYNDAQMLEQEELDNRFYVPHNIWQYIGDDD